MTSFSPLPAPLAILWASPASAIGFALGMLGLATGGRGQRQGRVLEFWGGSVGWLLRHLPLAGGASAITFGHTVLGQTAKDIESSREHERIHVRQYERWGPLFIPAYLICSLSLHLRGKDGYYDNPFEREAYGQSRAGE